MSKEKKNGKQDLALKTIVLLTVIIQLITTLIAFISKLME